jgi:NADH-quinone oxidoreductase subunit I
MREYLRNIYQTVRTILIGLRITLKYCFAKTVTVQYPDVPPTSQPRFRGFHHFEIERCIACEMCARACPVDCIHVEKSATRRLDKKSGTVTGGAILRYAIDYSKCLFCGLCVEPCPTQCVHMGDIHDMTCYDRPTTTVEFTELAKQGLRTPMPYWMTTARPPDWAVAMRERWLARGREARELMLKALEEQPTPGKGADQAAAAGP